MEFGRYNINALVWAYTLYESSESIIIIIELLLGVNITSIGTVRNQ